MRRAVSLADARAVVAAREQKRRQREAVLKTRGITPRRIVKARKDRSEATVKRDVRAKCVERDGYCRVALDSLYFNYCGGDAEWCHFVKRSQTRRMKPETRHNTRESFMACARHHDLQERGILVAVPQTAAGFDGLVHWKWGTV